MSFRVRGKWRLRTGHSGVLISPIFLRHQRCSQIEVTFDIDANGIVHVSAKDMGTGKEQKIRIESSSGLSESEIEKMVRDAEENADADKAAKALAEARNTADSLVYQSERHSRTSETR